ncbi:hypothetical protein NEF87_000383 [Candidatus Lokiarchaeum ossiferum]|uniref:DUF2812 domain-containing protein n=1 Tax=Candidatus Lokiarchaeum ossiferum TaxID=2951803 RepID=A0ABY6HKR3_9ARCH|nr:hypothetical protein NEF87_000383 [Candidatus Lokiarchaeum sp. B-35]
MNSQKNKYASMLECYQANKLPRGNNGSFFHVKLIRYYKRFAHFHAFDQESAIPIDEFASDPKFQVNLTRGYMEMGFIRNTPDFRTYFQLRNIFWTIFIELLLVSVLTGLWINANLQIWFLFTPLLLFIIYNLLNLFIVIYALLKHKFYRNNKEKNVFD